MGRVSARRVQETVDRIEVQQANGDTQQGGDLAPLVSAFPGGRETGPSSTWRASAGSPALTQRCPVVRIAETPTDREAIFRFRYRVFVEELGRQSGSADHGARLMYDELDKHAVLLYARDEAGQIVATARTNIMRPEEVPEHLKIVFSIHRFSSFQDCVVSFSSWGMIAREWRQTPLMQHMIIQLYHVLKQREVHFDFCHCRPAMVHAYESFGARRYADNFVDPDAGYQVPLVTVLNDVGYFKRVNPVIYGLSRRYKNDQRSVRWFYENFGDDVSRFVSCYASLDGFRRFLEQTRLEREVPLFYGLSSNEVVRFLEAGTVLRCKAGDLVVRQGEPSGEIYVLLSGFAEVRRETASGLRVLATLSQGDVFGEMGVVRKRPRSASIEALSEASVLVLSPRFFEKTMRVMPEVTARVLFNLSQILCERLERTTRNWVAGGQAMHIARTA